MFGFNSADLDYWKTAENVEYDGCKYFSADGVFFVLVFCDFENSKVKDVRCNCDEFEHPGVDETALQADSTGLCRHCVSALVVVSHQFNTDVIESTDPDVLPIPDEVHQVLE